MHKPTSRKRAQWFLVLCLVMSGVILSVSLAHDTLSEGWFPALLIPSIGVWTLFRSSPAKDA